MIYECETHIFRSFFFRAKEEKGNFLHTLEMAQKRIISFFIIIIADLIRKYCSDHRNDRWLRNDLIEKRTVK